MPGMFGGIGYYAEIYESLTKAFESIWGHCEIHSSQYCLLGANAFGDSLALHKTVEGLHFVVDGEGSIYNKASRFAQQGDPILFEFNEKSLELDCNCKGNIAILDKKNKSLYLATEWSGSFPLYYVDLGHGILFSSHQKPITKAIRLIADPVGIIQFMRYAIIQYDRTHFKEVKRLLPGQVLVYDLKNNHLHVYETSRAWIDEIEEKQVNKIAEHFWDSLGNAINRCVLPKQKHALMSSAGWDSRLLLAGLCKYYDQSITQGYSHGDIKSRELCITAQIYKDLGIDYHMESVDNSIYDLNTLQQCFNRVENVIFPYWYSAGIRLKELGVHSVSAGIFGEIIGGHYGKTMLMSNWQKMFFITNKFYRNNYSNKNEDVYDLLRLKYIEKPWYVNLDYWESISGIRDEINVDIKKSLERLKDRGIKDTNKIIEAYISESRGAQYIAAQLLSCRASLDVSNIFADKDLLILSSKIPISIKILNAFSQAVLRRYASDLLRYPTSAILTSAGVPIPIQELTRVIRKVCENLLLNVQLTTKGRIELRHLGWDNFEFLRDGKVLQSLLDDFKSDILDKNNIQEFIRKVTIYKVKYPLFNVSNQFMKIYTSDLLLR